MEASKHSCCTIDNRIGCNVPIIPTSTSYVLYKNLCCKAKEQRLDTKIQIRLLGAVKSSTFSAKYKHNNILVCLPEYPLLLFKVNFSSPLNLFYLSIQKLFLVNNLDSDSKS